MKHEYRAKRQLLSWAWRQCGLPQSRLTGWDIAFWGRRPRYRQCFFPLSWVPKWAPAAQQSNQGLFPYCQKTMTLFPLFQCFLPRQNHRWTKPVVCIVPTSFSYTYHMYTLVRNSQGSRLVCTDLFHCTPMAPYDSHSTPPMNLPHNYIFCLFSLIMYSLMAQTLSCSLSYPKHLNMAWQANAEWKPEFIRRE